MTLRQKRHEAFPGQYLRHMSTCKINPSTSRKAYNNGMFQRIHRSAKTERLRPLDTTDTEALTARELHRVETLTRRRQKLLLGINAVALATSATLSAYWGDVATNHEKAATSTASITTIGESLQHHDSTATIFFDGFNALSADYLAAEMGPSVQQITDGKLMSVSYGNAPLEPEKIADKIIDIAHAQHLDSVSLYGYSLGGIIGTEVAADIIDKSDLRVDAIYLNLTPDGSKGLLPERQEEINAMELIGSLPGAKYSNYLRFAGTMLSEADSYTQGAPIDNWNNFQAAWQLADKEIKEEQRPGFWLLIDQVLAISNANLNKNFQTIGHERDTKPMPVVVYLGTARPGFDDTVNTAESSDNICMYASRADLQCYVYNVPGAHHAEYFDSVTAYNTTLGAARDDLRNRIDRETKSFALGQHSVDAVAAEK